MLRHQLRPSPMRFIIGQQCRSDDAPPAITLAANGRSQWHQAFAPSISLWHPFRVVQTRRAHLRWYRFAQPPANVCEPFGFTRCGFAVSRPQQRRRGYAAGQAARLCLAGEDLTGV